MHLQFAELPVFDQDRAKAFYVEKLGCSVLADAPMGPDGWRWIELGFPGAETALHFVRRRDEALSDDPVLVLIDADVEGVASRLESKGVAILQRPGPAPYQPGVTSAEFADSEGNRMIVSSGR